MKRFVNYRKRGIQLPKGCKDLWDLLKSSKKSPQGEKNFHPSGEDKCEYCGAPAVTGWSCGMWSAGGTESEEAHFRCQQCDDDLREFESRPENRLPELPKEFDFEDSVATKGLERLMHEIREREKSFMLQRLAERKGPDHAG